MKIKKKKKPNTIEQLLETTEVLEKKSAYLERRIEDEAMTAKAFGTRKKRRKKFISLKFKKETVYLQIFLESNLF